MADKYEIPLVVEKRVRFFDGQYLQDQDFIDDQRYHIARARNSLRLFHGSGISDGLTVTSAQANAVTVAPGTALDSDGRQIVLTAVRDLPLVASKYQNQRGIKLYIGYDQQETDPQKDVGSADNTRFQEIPRLEAVLANQNASFTTPPVLLAQLNVDSRGGVTIDNSVRQYTGLRLPGPTAETPTLRTTPSGRINLTGSLTVEGSLGVGTTDPGGAKLKIVNSATDFVDVVFSGADMGPLQVAGWKDGWTINTKNDGKHLFLNREALEHSDVWIGRLNKEVTIKGDTGNVGIGVGNPLVKLEVAGEIKFTGDHLKTNAINRSTPFYIRGTGLNNSNSRVLLLGSTTVYSTGSGRGLTLTILNKADHSVVSTKTYDTYGVAANAETLATDLNGITKTQLGVLTSFDAWEANVTDSLRTAFRRVGLYKAAVISGDARRPYAAIFEASSATSLGIAKAVEVLYSANENAPFAEIRGWLMDGAFVATASAPNALTNNLGATPVLLVNEAGNVGIGTISPAQKLIVVGAHNAGKDPDNGMTYGGQLAIKGNAPQLDFIDTDHNDWSIHVNSNKLYFIRQPWNANDLILDGVGNVGIGTSAPRARLEVANTPAMASGTVTSAGTAVTGVDTKFQSELFVGGQLIVGNQTRLITAVTSDTALTVDSAFAPALTTAQTFSCRPPVLLDVASAGNQAGQSALLLRSGNNADNYTSNQLTFGYNGLAQYRHAIKTRHHNGQQLGNAIDFFVWKQGTDTPDTIGTLHTMSLNGGNVGIGTTTPTGKLDVAGDIRAGNSDLYFTKTDHNHTGLGNTTGYAAIENAANYEALMIMGRAGTAKGRFVGLWDYLQVNGSMDITDKLSIGTTNPGNAKLRVANSATDYADVQFSGSGMGQLQVIGWRDGWNINTKNDGKHLFLNRDALETSDVLIGRVGKELIVKGNNGNVLLQGDLSVPGGVEMLRIVRGIVSEDGTKFAGEGFTVKRVDIGIYDITFNDAFPSAPAVCVTQIFNGLSNSPILDDTKINTGGSPLDNAVIAQLSPNKIRIRTGDGGGKLSSRKFNFVAIGPR